MSHAEDLFDLGQESGSVWAFGSAVLSHALGLPPTMESVLADVLFGIHKPTTPALSILADQAGSIFERNPCVTELPGQTCTGVKPFSAHQELSAVRTPATVPAGSFRPTIVLYSIPFMPLFEASLATPRASC
jgi:hypothetical protein